MKIDADEKTCSGLLPKYASGRRHRDLAELARRAATCDAVTVF